MVVDINWLENVLPLDVGISHDDEFDDPSIATWNPICVGDCDLKLPKYIRKKYHSPKRRASELIKYLKLHSFKEENEN